MKLTALKISRAALARANSGPPGHREESSDFGVDTGNGIGSCKSGKDESRDGFELHFAFFWLYYWTLSTGDCFNEESR